MINLYVDTASAGGDGTTDLLVGATAAASHLAVLVAAIPARGYADDVTIFCNGGAGEDNVAVAFTAAPYLPANKTLLITANRGKPKGFHGGALNTGTYMLRTNAAIGAVIFVLGMTNKLVIEGIQIVSKVNAERLVLIRGQTIAGSGCWNCIMNGENPNNFGFHIDNANANWEVSNCVISTLVGNCGVNVDIGIVSGRNNVICGWTSGVVRLGGTVGLKNSEVFNNGDDFFGMVGQVLDRCASDDGDGTNPVVPASWAAQFFNPAYATALDFRLLGTSVLRFAGIGPAVDALVPALDMVGVARAGATCNIGPFEGFNVVPLVPRQWAQPYNGIITAVHLPAEIWRPSTHADMNPGAAAIFNNNFGAPQYDRIDGWTFSHPILLAATIGYSCIDTEIVLPEWVRNRIAGGFGAHIGIEFSYVTSGNASANSVFHFVAAKCCPEVAGALTGSPWIVGDASDVLGPVAFAYRVKGPITIYIPPSGVPAFVYGPRTVLRLRIGRYIQDFGGVGELEETWAFETTITGATIYYKTA